MTLQHTSILRTFLREGIPNKKIFHNMANSISLLFKVFLLFDSIQPQKQTTQDLNLIVQLQQHKTKPFFLFRFTCFSVVLSWTTQHVNFSGFYDTNMLWDIIVFTGWRFGKGTPNIPGK